MRGRVDSVDADREGASQVALLRTPEARVRVRRDEFPGQVGIRGKLAMQLGAEPDPELARVADRIPDLAGRREERIGNLNPVAAADHRLASVDRR